MKRAGKPLLTPVEAGGDMTEAANCHSGSCVCGQGGFVRWIRPAGVRLAMSSSVPIFSMLYVCTCTCTYLFWMNELHMSYLFGIKSRRTLSNDLKSCRLA